MMKAKNKSVISIRRRRSFIFAMLLEILALFQPIAHADEQQDTKQIIAGILNVRQAMIDTSATKSADDFIFLSFWDFDGTILKGDCSEGYKDDSGVVYPGLAQRCIEAGFSTIYPANGGFDTFWKDYRHMDEAIGPWLAYPFIPQILHGTRVDSIMTLCSRHFNTVLMDYYFASSIKILKTMKDNGIQPHIISASADVFVKAAARSLSLPPERFHGIELEVEEGCLTYKIVQPITWSDGKTAKLKSIVESIKAQNPDKQVVVLAAFGNSYSTDGPFLKYVASQALPAGKPVAVMINGGTAPPDDEGDFKLVDFAETCVP